MSIESNGDLGKPIRAWFEIRTGCSAENEIYFPRAVLSRMRRRISVQECVELLIEITNIHRQTIWVIDALDECHDPYELLDQLDTIQSKTSSSLNIFISSRHSIQTPNRLALALVIQHFKSSSDISAFIEGEIHSPSRRVRSGMTLEQMLQLHDLLLSRAEGM